MPGTGNVDPAEISVDEEGRIIIDNPALAAAVRNTLSRKGERREVAFRSEEAFNFIACGNNCPSEPPER